jgi:hypothetical protein
MMYLWLLFSFTYYLFALSVLRMDKFHLSIKNQSLESVPSHLFSPTLPAHFYRFIQPDDHWCMEGKNQQAKSGSKDHSERR